MHLPEIHSVWFDMDGVLAQWNPNGKYNIPENHYFRHVAPELTLINLFRRLYADYGRKVHAITTLCDKDGLQYLYESDKELWIRDVLPVLTTDIQTQYHPILRQTKANAAAYMLYKNDHLEKNDILVSDSNHDLLPWDSAGGLAFKYVNGYNNPNSYSGPKLYPEDTAYESFLRKVRDNL